MWLISLIPSRIQYYLIIVGAALAGVFGIYWVGGQNKKKEIEAEQNEERLENLKIAREVQDEIKALDDGDLRNRASKWVRGGSK